MKKLIRKMLHPLNPINKYRYPEKATNARQCQLNQKHFGPVNNQDGSVILFALMALVIMTVIGLISSDTAVKENFILRNQGIYKQNVNMVEAAIMEGLQQLMQIPFDNPNLINATGGWLNNKTTFPDAAWFAPDSSARVLSPATSLDITTPQALNLRGEAVGGNLLVSFVGWEVVTLPGGGGSESLVTGASQPAVIRKGRILGEYISQDAGGANNGFGMLRMEIGVERKVATL